MCGITDNVFAFLVKTLQVIVLLETFTLAAPCDYGHLKKIILLFVTLVYLYTEKILARYFSQLITMNGQNEQDTLE